MRKMLLLLVVLLLVPFAPAAATLSSCSLPACADLCDGEAANFYFGTYSCFIRCWSNGMQVFTGECLGTIGEVDPNYECSLLAASVPVCPSPPGGGGDGGGILNQDEPPDDGSGGGGASGGSTACPPGTVYNVEWGTCHWI